MREYDRLARGKQTAEAVRRMKVLRYHMSKRRKRIWRAAQERGWDTDNRQLRYNSLLARTR